MLIKGGHLNYFEIGSTVTRTDTCIVTGSGTETITIPSQSFPGGDINVHPQSYKEGNYSYMWGNLGSIFYSTDDDRLSHDCVTDSTKDIPITLSPVSNMQKLSQIQIKDNLAISSYSHDFELGVYILNAGTDISTIVPNYPPLESTCKFSKSFNLNLDTSAEYYVPVDTDWDNVKVMVTKRDFEPIDVSPSNIIINNDDIVVFYIKCLHDRRLYFESPGGIELLFTYETGSGTTNVDSTLMVQTDSSYVQPVVSSPAPATAVTEQAASAVTEQAASAVTELAASPLTEQAATDATDTTDANTCTCPNGTAATSPKCTSDNAVICSSCNTGYTLSGVTCNANTCKCDNGTAATRGKCTKDGDEICVSCDDKYTLKDGKCVEDFNWIPIIIGGAIALVLLIIVGVIFIIRRR